MKLLDRMRRKIRLKQYSMHTEKTDVHWIYTHVANKGELGVRSPLDLA